MRLLLLLIILSLPITSLAEQRFSPETVRLKSTFIITGDQLPGAKNTPVILTFKGHLTSMAGTAREVENRVYGYKVSDWEIRAPLPRSLVDDWGLDMARFSGIVALDNLSIPVSFDYLPTDIMVILVKMFGFATPDSTTPPIMILIITLCLCALVILLVVFALFAGIASWAERRVAGRMQNRIGPNRVGPQGFLQWIADGLKCFLKEDFIPQQGLQILFRIGPYFPMLGVVLTFATLPFGHLIVVSDLNVGVFYVIAVTGLTVIGILIGGFSSANKWSLLGGFRSAAQIVSYEIPAGIALMPVIAMAGSLSFETIIKNQGGFPWQWYLFHNPFTFIAFFIYFISTLAEGNRTPFDLPEAESELVAGYNTEYSGLRFVFFFFAEWGNLYVMSAIMTSLFLGGWQVPFVTPDQMANSIPLTIFGWALFTAKTLFLVFVVMWLRWTLPRVRIDQLMTLCWKYLTPIGVIAFLGASAFRVWVSGTPQIVVSFAMFSFGLVIFVLFWMKVIRLLKSFPMKISINPFV